jgi:capsular exopolysaccharide synthesis family protein
MMIGGMTFGSFGLGVMAIVLFELRKRTIDSADEVALGLGIDLVGALPRLPARTRKRGLVDGTKDDFWRNLLRESIDITRTVLLHAARNRSYRVVMVTSAISGEGKTSLSSHLAISMARCGLKTLLIDADLRRPSVQLLFDLPKTPGLADILRGSHDLEQCVSSCHFENLDVLTAGEIDQRCLRALSAGRIATLFEEVKQNYDFVIVDSSPVLQVADSLLVAPHADAVIFSIIQDVSRTPKVIAAYQKLQSVGVRILGAVVASSSGDLYSNDHYRYAGRSYYSASVGEASDPSGHEEPKVFPS